MSEKEQALAIVKKAKEDLDSGKISRRDFSLIMMSFGALAGYTLFSSPASAWVATRMRKAKKATLGRTVDVCDIFGDGSGKALYRMDGNTNDESGTYHGTENAIIYGGGAYERGAVFNGSSSYIQTQYLEAASANGLTFSAWIKSTNTTSNMDIMGSFNSAGTTANLFFGIWAGKYIFGTGSLNYDNTTYSALAVLDGQWHHLVTTWSGNSVKYYADGVLVGTFIAQTVGRANNGVPYTIGKGGNFAGDYFNGSIDQLRIINRAVTQAEVTALYNEAKPTSILSNTNPFSDASCTAMYKFDGDATDATGTYNGTLTGTPTYTTGKFGTSALVSSNINNNYVTISNPSIVGVSCWVKFTGLPVDATFHTIYGQSNSLLIIRYVSAGVYTIGSYLQANGGYYVITSPNVSLTLNTWTHFHTHIDSAGLISIYLNGTPVSLNVSSTKTAAAYNPTIIFGQYAVGGAYTAYTLQGAIDQVRIFNKILTPMEVACLYCETTPLEEPLHSLVDPFKDGSGKALYRLDGNANDESGNYNATASSMVYSAGKAGRCGDFTTLAPSCTIPKTVVNSLTSFTCTAWVYMTDVTSSSCVLTCNAVAGNYFVGPVYTVGSGTVIGAFGLAGTSAIYTPTLAILVNTWTLVTFVFNSDKTIQLSVNGGTLTAKSAASGYNLSQLSTDLALFNSGSADFATGKIDQIRFFNRALTQAEITQLYSNQA